MWWIAVASDASPSIAVLTTVIALTLARRTFSSRSEFVRSSLVLPIVGLAAAGVGWLLLHLPLLGALLFVLGMSCPIWLRRFGERASRLGTLITLPFVAILVAPVAHPLTGRWWTDLVMVVVASLVAIAWVWLLREVELLVTRGRNTPSDVPTARRVRPPRQRTGADGRDTANARRRMAPSTRMAAQMAVALTAAFVAGWLVFPDHAMWTVLTAFIVCAGNRGRADVVYKSALRVGGALLGTLGAVALSLLIEPTGLLAVVAIFVALFIGTWLRQRSYAYWALTITLVLTLLQGVLGLTPSAPGFEGWLLVERMLAIVLGALLGIAASWFVLPVRSADVVRRRLAEVLSDLSDAFAPGLSPEQVDERLAELSASVDRLAQLAPAHRAHRQLAGRRTARAIDCIETALLLPAASASRIEAESRLPEGTITTDETKRLRDAIVTARRSLAAPTDFDRIRRAITALVEELGQHPGTGQPVA